MLLEMHSMCLPAMPQVFFFFCSIALQFPSTLSSSLLSTSDSGLFDPSCMFLAFFTCYFVRRITG